MIWRSVVGKLWLTILGLLTVVLLILTILLLQFFEQFNISEAENQLTNNAEIIATALQEENSPESSQPVIDQIAGTYNSEVMVFIDGDLWYGSGGGDGLAASDIQNSNELGRVAGEREQVTVHDTFSMDGGEDEIFAVGEPFTTNEGREGEVYVYQSLSVIEETTGETKQIILLSAGIAIILTTVFAFFLSTRITAPLRKMRELALNVLKGDFDSKVPVVSNDEIGQLGNAFNRMRRELSHNLTALNQEKEQLSRILHSMADGVITFDRGGTMVLTNPPADYFIRLNQLENKQEASSLPGEVTSLFEKAVETEMEQLDEFEVQGRSFAVLVTPLYGNEDVRGAVAVVRDMTEERRHDKLRKDFIANVSHELRTPISMLQGYSEAIVDDIAATEEEKKEIGRIIYDESLRMGRLVNELLDLARMEAGYLKLEKEEEEVTSFFQRVERKFQGLADESEVQLNLDLHAPEEYAFIDVDRVEQILTNLVHNAIRHTEAGGSITIRAVNADSLHMEVSDTGSGISKEDLPYVFERFYKADKARTRGKGGTGLGLAIVKNIVDAHHGAIAAESEPGEGTTFYIDLPNK
ncbi:ATP-binding protein [Marinococcus halotolerans]|uniref:ATP-binding protein n=1 Tax=Marinococcus halotolerans TaxID=301092 RepID=UPI0003B36338|nr:ATP-binding protein [Marinococcus halotolerans]